MDVVAILNLVITVLTGLVGLPALVAVVTDFLLYLKVSAEIAQWVAFGLNVAAAVGIFVAIVTGNLPLVDVIDGAFVGIAKLLVDILAVLGVLGINLVSTKKLAVGMAQFGDGFREARQLIRGGW